MSLVLALVLSQTPTVVQQWKPRDGGVWATEGTITNTVSVSLDGGVAAVTIQKKAPAALAQAVTCTTSATALPASPLASRVSVCVQNLSSAVVYVGHASVTSSTGTALAPANGTTPGGSFCDDIGAQPLYCIVAAGTGEVRLLEN